MVVLVIAKKEIKEHLRNKKAFFSMVILPLIMWTFIGLMQNAMFASFTGKGGIFGPAPPLEAYVCVEDNGTWGKVAYSLVLNLSSNFNVRLHNTTFQEGKRGVENGTFPFFLYVPGNFTDSIQSSGYGVIAIWYDASSQRASAFAEMCSETLSEILSSPRYHVVVRSYTTFASAMYFVVLMLTIAIMMAFYGPMPALTSSFAGERERKTLEVLLATPNPRWKILAGKLATAFFIGALSLASHLVGLFIYVELLKSPLSTHVPSAEQGLTPSISLNTWQIAVAAIAIVLSIFCALSLGIVVSCLSKTQKDAESYYNAVVMLPMLLAIMGSSMGIKDLPLPLYAILVAIPMTHGPLLFYDATVGNAPMWFVVFHVVYLLGFSLALLFVGIKLFQREEVVEVHVKRKRKFFLWKF